MKDSESQMSNASAMNIVHSVFFLDAHICSLHMILPIFFCVNKKKKGEKIEKFHMLNAHSNKTHMHKPVCLISFYFFFTLGIGCIRYIVSSEAKNK